MESTCGRQRWQSSSEPSCSWRLKTWWDASKPVDLQAAAIQVGNLIPSELAKYDGQDPFRPILLALRGTVLDVTAGREMYGPGALHVPLCRPWGAHAIGMIATSLSIEASQYSYLDCLAPTPWASQLR